MRVPRPFRAFLGWLVAASAWTWVEASLHPPREALGAGP